MTMTDAANGGAHAHCHYGQPHVKTSFPKSKIKVLLLENINTLAINILKSEGFVVEAVKGALSEDELKERIKGVHAIGIRSKSQITEAVLQHADRLLAIGCFCIGTDQVDLGAAERKGIPVFNSPFMNSRSVAELMIAEIIMLSRQLGDRNKEMHRGEWNKVSANCHEVRGKTLGIVGYGHIGSQLSVLAESLGMKVLFFDIVNVMPLGNSRPVASLNELLASADFVSLHVPDTPETVGMIGAAQIAQMRPGTYLINASRGKVVDIEALRAALMSGHLAGAAVDVYPTEPRNNCKDWASPLVGCPNTILTPHIGGSTEEAQEKIGEEVAQKLVKLINIGSTHGAVNFPNVEIPYVKDSHRILNTHKNVPGVLKQINGILGDFNIVRQ
eukprot:Opistho-1_new@94152